MTDINYMNIKEFREFGYLQELNRLFLHPLGLALEVQIDDAGNETLGGVWDYRHDPEGMSYAEDVIDPEKARRIFDEEVKRHSARLHALGYFQQPVR